jgi:prepilin-type N-terminal cleavage/methylation domain-containing protein
MRIKLSSRAGFTLVEIMTVAAIIGLLAALAVPHSLKARSTAQKSICISNLRQVDSAKQQWAVEMKKTDGAACNDVDVVPYIKGLKMPQCPAGGANSYTVNAIGEAPVCTIEPATHVLP